MQERESEILEDEDQQLLNIDLTTKIATKEDLKSLSGNLTSDLSNTVKWTKRQEPGAEKLQYIDLSSPAFSAVIVAEDGIYTNSINCSTTANIATLDVGDIALHGELMADVVSLRIAADGPYSDTGVIQIGAPVYSNSSIEAMDLTLTADASINHLWASGANISRVYSPTISTGNMVIDRNYSGSADGKILIRNGVEISAIDASVFLSGERSVVNINGAVITHRPENEMTQFEGARLKVNVIKTDAIYPADIDLTDYDEVTSANGIFFPKGAGNGPATKSLTFITDAPRSLEDNVFSDGSAITIYPSIGGQRLYVGLSNTIAYVEDFDRLPELLSNTSLSSLETITLLPSYDLTAYQSVVLANVDGNFRVGTTYDTEEGLKVEYKRPIFNDNLYQTGQYLSAKYLDVLESISEDNLQTIADIRQTVIDLKNCVVDVIKVLLTNKD